MSAGRIAGVWIAGVLSAGVLAFLWWASNDRDELLQDGG